MMRQAIANKQQAVAEAAAESAQAVQRMEWEDLRDAGQYREMTRRGLMEVFGLDEQQADARMAVYDARAQVSQRYTGQEPEEWYRSRIGGFETGRGAELYQLDPKLLPDFDRKFGNSKVVDNAGKPLGRISWHSDRFQAV